MSAETNPPELELSLPWRFYWLLPGRLQRLLLLRTALARAALLGLLVAALNLRPVRADTPVFSLYEPFEALLEFSGPRPVLVDLDADGDQDILTGEEGGDLYYFKNTGSAANPVFADPLLNPFGLDDVGFFSSPALGDLDNDGDLDVLVGNSYGNFSYFENTGSAATPTFIAPISNPFDLADIGSYAAPALADLDDDGDLDLLAGTFDGDLIYFENGGTPQTPDFDPAVTNPFGLSNLINFSAPTLTDLDGDDDVDVLAGAIDGDFHYFQNTSANPNVPVFASDVTNPFGLDVNGLNSVITLADLDGDGDLDALAGGSKLHRFPNIGDVNNPLFAEPPVNPFGLIDAGFRVAPTLGDLDNDGDLDALLGDYSGNLHYFQNTGNADNASFAAPVTNPFGLSDVGSYAQPALADLDDDGDLDVLVGTSNGDLLYFENTSLDPQNPVFVGPDTNPFNLSNEGVYSAPALADLDGDGDLDVLVGVYYGSLHYFENISADPSTPEFAAPINNPFGLVSYSGYYSFYYPRPTVADLDGDGDQDILSGDVSGNLHYFENTGDAENPAFAPPEINPFGLVDAGHLSAPALADLDNDGDLDALVGVNIGLSLYFERVPAPNQPVYIPIVRKSS